MHDPLWHLGDPDLRGKHGRPSFTQLAESWLWITLAATVLLVAGVAVALIF